MTLKNQVILCVVLLAIGVFGWQFKEYIPFLDGAEKSEARSSRGSRAVRVIVAPVIVKDLAKVVTAVGTLIANESIDVTAKVTTKIRLLNFTEGTYVKKGTSLVYLDATEAEAVLAESKAELENSRKLYERSLKLFKTRNIPKARVDLLLSEMQVAQAKVSANKARLDDYIIRAPFSGILGMRDASVGALVRPADIITTLDDITTLKLDFNLPESLLANISPGQSLSAKSVAFPGRSFVGDVKTVATRIDPVIRAVRIRGTIPNENGELKPGMFMSVELQTGIQKGAVLVPEHAVTISAAGHFVFIVSEGIAYRKEVVVGQRIPEWAQILSGLKGTELVVTEGLQKIRDGQKVTIETEDAPAKTVQKASEPTQ
ncbi:MAG: efflux RND transporter periplasmic adaptor subunit [Sneathiella sp.]|nr:efflux RND transporter periplasmic adaptor subunit [Sneathiella sp.]